MTWFLQTIRVIGRILTLAMMAGCNDVSQVAREAANRQAQQNTVISELNKEVATGAQRLVTSDSQAREDFLGVHHDLQAERTRLDAGWTALEIERQTMARDRRTQSLVVPLVSLVGGTVLTILVLAFSWQALGAANREQPTSAELNEIILAEMWPSSGTAPAWLDTDSVHQLSE